MPARKCRTGVRGENAANDSVFFLQMGTNGAMQLWAGPGSSEAFVAAIQKTTIQPDRPTDVNVAGTAIPFRVATLRIDDGSRVYLGLSERDELRVLNKLRLRFYFVVAAAGAAGIWDCLLHDAAGC